MSGWKPEDQRNWEELERRAAAQAKELYARRQDPGIPPEPPAPQEKRPEPPPRETPAPGNRRPPQRHPKPPAREAPAAPLPGRGRLAPDQLLLLALLCLLVEERADTKLILAVAYVLMM